MDVHSHVVFKVFSSGGDIQYVLPHFQREYAWEKSNWQTLLNDIWGIYEIYDEDSPPEHFLGALVVIKDGMRNGIIPAFKLVDGQQRLTTISILLCVLSELVVNTNPSLHRKLRKLITNPDEEGLLHYKLIPTKKYGDQETYINLVNGDPVSNDHLSKIPDAFNYIYGQLETKLTTGIDPEKLFLVIANCMHVVFIDLDQKERPFEIFESLNAKGKPLTQPDLVRNYVAMKLPEKEQETIFDQYWSEIETLLVESRTVSRIGELTAFLRHYLAFRSGTLFNKDHIYARFRDRMEANYSDIVAFKDEVKTLARFARYYDRLLRPEKEPDVKIRSQLERLYILDIATAYPFLLFAYENYDNGQIAHNDFIDGLQVLENYLVRRYVAGEKTNYHNKMFPTLNREIDKSKFATSLKNALLTKNYPSDNRLKQILLNHQIYDSRRPQKLILVLQTINRHLSQGTGGHTILDNLPTIEHIMPQTLEHNWKKHLGADWEEIYQEYLHTLGNLTLVTQEWNSSLSNSPFEAKQKRLKNHGLLLNSLYFEKGINTWNDQSIRERTEALTDQILTIWSAFGDPPLPKTMTGQKPQLFIFLGQSYEVKSWRDVAYQMAECTSELVDDFDSIAEEMGFYFSREERNRSRQLMNGWWIYLNLSSNTVMKFCESMIAMTELSDEDWDVEI